MVRRASGLLALLLLAGSVHAGTFTTSPDPALVAPGGAVTFGVFFTGEGTTAGAQIDLGYNSTVFTSGSTAGMNGGACNLLAGPARIRVITDIQFGPLPAFPREMCRVTLNVAPGAAPGNYNFAPSNVLCSDDIGDPFTPCGTSGTLRITVDPNVAPTLTYAPVPTALPPGPSGGTASTTITVSRNGGAGTGTVTRVCTAAGFTLTNPSQTIGIATTPTAIGIACTRGAALVPGTLSCTETDAPGGASRILTWPLTCPAGGTPPTLSYAPAADTTVTLSDGAIGAAAQASIAVSALGGEGVGSVSLSCGTTSGFTLGGGSQSITVGATPVPLVLGCTRAGSTQNGTLDCTETDAPAAVTRPRSWPIVCPAGTAGTLAADRVIGNRAGSVAVNVRFTGNTVVHSFVTDLVFDRNVLTPTTVAGANGATCFRRPAPNDDRIAVSVPTTGNPLAAVATPYCTIGFDIGALAPIAPVPLTFVSTTCLDGSNVATACTTDPGEVRISAYDSEPAPGRTLHISGPTGSSARRAVLASNLSAAPLALSSCTLTAPAAITLTSPATFSIAAFDSATIALACNPPVLGGQILLGELSCSVDEPPSSRIVRYGVLCSRTLPIVPAPGNQLGSRETRAGALFGTDVAVTETAANEEVLVFGAPGAGANGAAYVMVRTPAEVGAFGKRRIVRGAAFDPLDFASAHVLTTPKGLGNKFGAAVAVSPGGDTIAVGAPLSGNGTVAVFRRPAGGWASLDVPDVTLNAPTSGGVVADDFGAELAFASDGTLYVGAPASDVSGLDGAGAAFGYAPVTLVPQAPMVAPVPSAGGEFGTAIAAHGTRLVVGEPGSAGGRGAAYHSSGGALSAIDAASFQIGDKFGTSVAVSGPTIVVGAPGANANGADSGAVVVYDAAPVTPVVRGMLVPEAGASQGAGMSVATNGDLVVVGAPLSTVSGRAAQGRAYLYEVEGASATTPPFARLDNANGQASDTYASAVAVTTRRLLIGVPLDDNELAEGGVEADEGRADPYIVDRIMRQGFE